jgi:DNA polymerase-3 subunit delta'
MLFAEVIGQDGLKDHLITGVNTKRISHAQLFLGNTGAGLLPLALAYSQYVNCTNRNNSDSCGKCNSCVQIQKLDHPDLYFSFPVITGKISGRAPVSNDFIREWKAAILENPYLSYQDWMQYINAENKQGNITADECREIIRKLSLKPLYEGFKIMIIFLPEYMGKEGNILLKLLEEPPENTLFLLLSNDEEKILSTVLSRTQVLRVPLLNDIEIKSALELDESLSVDKAARIAFLANGDYNRALNLISNTESDFTSEFIKWMRACIKPDMAVILKWVDSIAGSGRENQKNFLLYALNLLRESYMSYLGLGKLTRLLESEKEFIEKFSAFINDANIVYFENEISKVHYKIERNGNPKVLFFNLSLFVNEQLQRQNRQYQQ